MDLENFGQSAAELKIAFETLQEQIKNNAKLLAKLTGDAARGFEPSISKAKKLTDELAKANKQSLSNYKERLQFESKLQQVQKELVGLNRQREILTSRLSISTKLEKVTLLKLIDNYNDLIYSSQELVNNTKKLKEELQPINEDISTKLLGSLSDLASKIPGISRFAEPFKEASKAAEKISTHNQLTFGSTKGISKAQLESLKTGKGLSAEFSKQLGLVDKNGNALRGTAAANKARASGITAAAGNSISPLIAGIKSLGSALMKSLGPLYILYELVEALKGADKGAGELAKGFNMTYDEALKVREELTQIGDLSGDVALNTRALQESMMAVGKALGSNAMLNEKDLVTFTKLREQAGFTNEELLGIEKTTLATGGNLEKNAKNILFSAKLTGLNNKVLLNEKDIMRDVAKASDAIKLSLGGSGKKLGEAAAQAKALGMSLEQVDKIAGSLLDFESSITNELSAELITGKQINLEQARLYALNNDMAGLSREIAKNFGSVAEFGKMNRIQQEAAAKAVGMQREELATTLTDQAALKGLSGDKLKDAQAALNYARAQGMTEDQIAQQSIDNLMKQQSIQDRLNQSVEKLKEIFVSIAEPILEILSPLMDLITGILPPLMGTLQPVLGILKAIAHVISGIVQLLTLDITGAMKSFGSVGSDLVGGITSSTQFKIAKSVIGGSETKMAKGGQILPGYENDTYPALLSSGETVVTKPMTSKLNDENFHIKTLNPFKLQQQQQQSQPFDYDRMAKALSNQPIQNNTKLLLDGAVVFQSVAKKVTTEVYKTS